MVCEEPFLPKRSSFSILISEKNVHIFYSDYSIENLALFVSLGFFRLLLFLALLPFSRLQLLKLLISTTLSYPGLPCPFAKAKRYALHHPAPAAPKIPESPKTSRSWDASTGSPQRVPCLGLYLLEAT
jgi:hypothetical protein